MKLTNQILAIFNGGELEMIGPGGTYRFVAVVRSVRLMGSEAVVVLDSAAVFEGYADLFDKGWRSRPDFGTHSLQLSRGRHVFGPKNSLVFTDEGTREVVTLRQCGQASVDPDHIRDALPCEVLAA